MSGKPENTKNESKKVSNTLVEVVRQKVFDTLVKSTKISDMQMMELDNKDDFVYDYWMAFILISGSAIKIMLKIHFNSILTKKILMVKMKKDINGISDRVTMDFFREQCNLIAGAIKGSLNSAGIITGLSIPLVTRGFDEAIFSDVLDKSKINDAWEIKWSEGAIVCSTVIEILKESELEKISNIKEMNRKEEEGGDDLDGEFL